jgi:hypothetical protein
MSGKVRVHRCWFQLAAAAAGGFLAGCGSGPLPVRLEGRESSPAVAPAARPGLVLLPVVDGRPEGKGASSGGTNLGPVVVTSDSVRTWVEQELLRQLSPKRDVQRTEVPAAAAGLRVSVRTCYVQPVGGHLSAQVVLEAEWLQGTEVRRREIVRGQRVGSVWFSATDEVATALRLALEQAVAELLKTAPAP